MSTRSSGSTVAGSALKPWGYLWRKQKPHRELWRPVPRRRTDLHRLRRVCDQPNRGQVVRQTSIDALDTSGCTPASSDPNTRPQQRPRSSHPSLLPRLPEITGHRHCPRFVIGPYICRSRSAFLTSRTWLPNGGCGVLRDVPPLDEPLRTADRRATAEGPRQAPRKLASCRSLYYLKMMGRGLAVAPRRRRGRGPRCGGPIQAREAHRHETECGERLKNYAFDPDPKASGSANQGGIGANVRRIMRPPSLNYVRAQPRLKRRS